MTEILWDQNKRVWNKAYNLYSKIFRQRQEKQAYKKDERKF